MTWAACFTLPLQVLQGHQSLFGRALLMVIPARGTVGASSSEEDEDPEVDEDREVDEVPDVDEEELESEVDEDRLLFPICDNNETHYKMVNPLHCSSKNG